MSTVMTSSDPSVTAAVVAAQDKIRAVVDLSIVEVANNLLFLMKSAGTYRERGQLAFAQIHILESRELFLSSFATALRDRVSEDIAAKSDSKPAGETTDWQSISLVDEGQIEDKISFERIGQLIGHRSETELRELDGYMSGLLRHGWADPARNPLRGAVIGFALHRAIEKVTEEPETQKIFARELSQAMANLMPTCYREISADLKRRAIRPTDLAMRPVDDAAARAPTRPSTAGTGFEEARKAWEQSWIGRMPARSRAAAAQLGKLDPRPPRQCRPARCARPRELGGAARSPDPWRHAGIDRGARRGAAAGGGRGRRRADEPAAPPQRRLPTTSASSIGCRATPATARTPGSRARTSPRRPARACRSAAVRTFSRRRPASRA